MKRMMVSSVMCLLLLLLGLPGVSEASCPFWKSLRRTGRCVVFRPPVSVVQQPLWRTWEKDDFSLPRQSTVLEPVGGTGSKLPTGPARIVPDSVTHKLDPATIQALKEALSETRPVGISPQLSPETSERLLRFLTLLEWLLGLGGVLLGASGVGKLSAWGARGVGGLRSVLQARSQATGPIPGEELSDLLRLLRAGKAEAGSLTSKPGS